MTPPRVASISRRTLLDCTKAISEPEKSPEKSIAAKAIKSAKLKDKSIME